MNTADIKPADTESFIIAKTEEGFRVCSPLAPAKQFVVSGLPHNPRCTCWDGAQTEGNPLQSCKHVSAVLKQLGFHPESQESAGEMPATNPLEWEIRPSTPKKKKNERHGNEAIMLLKRSISPDGHIDSLSIEFSCPVGAIRESEIKQQAATMLRLQSEIASGFLTLNGNGQGNGMSKPQSNNSIPSRGTPQGIPGQMLAIASMPGKWGGRRLFINVLVNGQVLKFFGSEKQLAEALTEAGFSDIANQMYDGLMLNLPCQVVTKPSPDGKYTNIERILTAQAAGSKG